MITNQTHAQKLMDKAKLTSAQDVPLTRVKKGSTPGQKDNLGFYPQYYRGSSGS
jgi:hypothetical protein